MLALVLLFILPVFSQERAAVIADSDDSDISWRENIAAARERLRYRQNHIEDSDSGEIMTEYKEEIESQLLIDTAHKPEPAPVVAAVPGPHWRVDGFAVFGCGAAVVYLQSGQPVLFCRLKHAWKSKRQMWKRRWKN